MVTSKYITALFLFVVIGFTSEQDDETIPWCSENRLTWDDFKGAVPSNQSAAAITASGITYRFSTYGTRDSIQVVFKINTFFYPTKSWYQPEMCNTLILGHEQLHFDISELYARKLKKRLESERYAYGTVKTKVKSIYRKINEELDVYQNLYDAETNFSRNMDKQAEWKLNITMALKGG